MKVKKTSALYDEKNSLEFYENRYQQGYMNDWPIERKNKLVEVINKLHLPAKGEALDFGCGNGVLTDIIRKALPSWKIYGTDLSETALSNAKMRFPHCSFFNVNSSKFIQKKFDFIFTNHVIEHVYNLAEVFNQMNDYLKLESSMLHILPCGNEGSYEWSICQLRKDGINSDLENRYFYEDEGHVRRLTTSELCNLCKTKGFELKKEFYYNQYYGAIDWITNSPIAFVILFTDTSQALDKIAKYKLIKVKIKLLFITRARKIVKLVKRMFIKKEKRLKHYVFLLMIILPYVIILSPIDSYFKRNARKEWERKNTQRNGSGMYLFFSRNKEIS